MQEKLSLIVLRGVRYGENSRVLKAYTEHEGLRAFMVSTARKGKGAAHNALLQPLSLLEVVYYARGKGDLKRIKEAKVLYPFQSIPYDPVKACVALFLAEFLQKVLSEEEAAAGTFEFLRKAIINLDQAKGSVANYHLVVLTQLGQYLGFAMQHWPAKQLFFDLMEGQAVDNEPMHRHFLKGDRRMLWNQMRKIHLDQWQYLKLSGKVERNELLNSLLDYYRLHLHDFGELRSLPILKEVLS